MSIRTNTGSERQPETELTGVVTFQIREKVYHGASALDIVRAMEADAEHYPYRGQSVRKFLGWSLERLGNRLPPRDLDLSDLLGDDELALNYLYLRDEYGAGKLQWIGNDAGLKPPGSTHTSSS